MWPYHLKCLSIPNADALGALRILEAIKFHRLEKKTKFYQAGTSEMYGRVQETPQVKKQTFIHLALMVLLNSMLIG